MSRYASSAASALARRRARRDRLRRQGGFELRARHVDRDRRWSSPAALLVARAILAARRGRLDGGLTAARVRRPRGAVRRSRSCGRSRPTSRGSRPTSRSPTWRVFAGAAAIARLRADGVARGAAGASCSRRRRSSCTRWPRACGRRSARTTCSPASASRTATGTRSARPRRSGSRPALWLGSRRSGHQPVERARLPAAVAARGHDLPQLLARRDVVAGIGALAVDPVRAAAAAQHHAARPRRSRARRR